jgi:outer membrane protein assembly factor BamB
VAIGQGDGFVRAFDCETGAEVWRFDVNSNQERELTNQYLKRRLLTESPVFDGRHLYFAIGDDREASFERGGIYCIDPFGSGDVSREIMIDGRYANNPNSKWIWEHSAMDGQKVHTSIAGLCVTSRFLFAADSDGWAKCFDKRTGKSIRSGRRW